MRRALPTSHFFRIAVRIFLQAQIDERRAEEQRQRALASADAVAIAYARRIGWAA